MKKITFLNCSMKHANGKFRGTRKPLQPLDIMYMYNTFQGKGHELRFIEQEQYDIQNENLLTEDVFLICTTNSYLTWNNHFLSLVNINNLIEYIYKIRPKKDFKIVIFGPHAINHYEHFIEKYNVDAVIIGEPDLTVEPVVEALLNDRSLDQFKNVVTADKLNRKIIPIPCQVDNLDDLPMPNWDICKTMEYSAHNSPKVFNRGFLYETSRGCPFQCSYCNTETHRRKYRTKSIVKIKQELEEMIYKYGAEYVYFIDESFGYDDEWVNDLIGVLKDLPLEWGCQGNLKFTYPEKLKKMAEAGCINMEFGFETFNYDILKKSRKINDLDRVKETIDTATNVGISPLLFLLVGLPGETLETLKNTVDFLKILKPGFRFSTGIPIPYPHTDYYRKGIKAGVIKPGQNDETLYELSGMIGNDFTWNIDKKNEFCDKYGPNIWGNKLNIEHFEKDLFNCFETRKEEVYVKC